MSKRVAITGLGVVSPIGTGINNFLHSLKNGISGIKYIEELSSLNFACRIGGIPDISDSKFLPFIKNNELIEADISIQYSVIAGIEAWISAGLNIPETNSDKINDNAGAIIGTCAGGVEIFMRKMLPLISTGKVKRLGSQIIEHWMSSGSAATLSKILALANQTSSNSSACSTGLEAIIMAYDRIKSGKAKIMLVGGSDPYSPYAWAGFDSMRLLCRKYNDTPEQASRPMSISAAGFVPSAGAGILILEDYEHAKNRKAKIYAEIIGATINSGGQRQGGTMTSPNSQQVINCITKTLEEANVSGNDIDLISGHLTGTMADSIEIKNWKTALNLKNKFPYINSTKSLLGHSIGAAGAIETIATVLQIQHKFIHLSKNCEDLNPEIKFAWDTKKIPQETIENIEINYAIKASFGFGDVNSCIILKKNH
jgi:3-oxoacyl-(acyl-carrier-protein) synthase